MSLLWINGQLIDKTEARVSPFDHGFLYGDGVWEHVRVFGGQLFLPDEHVQCLYDAASVLRIDIPLSQPELIEAINTTVQANHRTEGYIRVIVTRGPGTIGPDPRKLDAQVIIIAEEYQPFPAELYGHGLHVICTSIPFMGSNRRWLDRRLLGQRQFVIAKRDALERGCLEALLMTEAGLLVGGTEGPVFLVCGNEIRLSDHHQPEVMTKVIRDIATGLGLGITVVSLGLPELRDANEVFLAGTACGVIGIIRIDGKDIGSGTEGSVTQEIRRRYHALTRGLVG